MDEDHRIEYTRGDRCDIDGCRSRRYHINAAGHNVCDNGHQHDLARTEEEDESAYGETISGKKHKAQEKPKEKFYKHLKGREALELYVLCYQLILRKQVWWLIHDKGFPEELEVVVRDLWTLRMQQLRTRLPRENPATSETESGAESDASSVFFTSQSESEASIGTDLETSRTSNRARGFPNLRESLALMYMASEMLRLPVMLSDVFLWAKSGHLLYHRAFAHLPRDMLDRLPAQYQSQFRPKTHLSRGKLLESFTSLVIRYDRAFGISLPALNLPAHLFRLIEELHLPIEVYYATRRLASFIDLNFTYTKIVRSSYNVLDLPEAQLVATLAVVVKLFYGLDGSVPIPTVHTSPAAAVIDWETWIAEMNGHAPLDRDLAMKMTDKDAVEFSNTRIDEYLRFFENNFLVPQPTAKGPDVEFNNDILNYFPISRSEENGPPDASLFSQSRETVRKMQASLTPNVVLSEQQTRASRHTVSRPGEQYVRHRNVHDLSGRTESFFLILERVTGLPMKNIVRAITYIETALQRRGATRKVYKGRKGKAAEARSRRHAHSDLVDPEDMEIDDDDGDGDDEG